MAWNGSIPQPNDMLSQSQLDILNNFTELNKIVTLAPNAAGIQFPLDTAVPTTAATTVALYGAASVEYPAETALYFRKQNLGASIDFTSAGKAVTGWCRLPSGIIMKWGIDTIVAGTIGNNVLFTVAATIPVFTNPCLAVFVTVYGWSAAGDVRDTILGVTNLTAIGFRAERKVTGVGTEWYGTGVSYRYLAIGY